MSKMRQRAPHWTVGPGNELRARWLRLPWVAGMRPRAGNGHESAAGKLLPEMRGSQECGCILLTGEARDSRLLQVTLALAAEMLVSGGLAPMWTKQQRGALAGTGNGEAPRALQPDGGELGGPLDFLPILDRHLDKGTGCLSLPSVEEGYGTGYDTRAHSDAVSWRLAVDRIGRVILSITASGTDPICWPIGARVEKTPPLAVIHARNGGSAGL